MLLTTISCMVQFSTFCFTYRASCQGLASIQTLTFHALHKKFTPSFQKLEWRSGQARWIKTCLVSNKRYGVTIIKLSVLVHVSYKVVVALNWNSAYFTENISKKKYRKKKIKMKRCRDGVPKYTHYTPSGKKKKERNEWMNVEKSHKSACIFPSLRGLPEVWHHIRIQLSFKYLQLKS